MKYKLINVEGRNVDILALAMYLSEHFKPADWKLKSNNEIIINTIIDDIKIVKKRKYTYLYTKIPVNKIKEIVAKFGYLLMEG